MRNRSQLALVLLASAMALAGCNPRSQNELMASAKGHLEKNEPKAAAIQLKNLLQSEPDSAEARFLLGKALLASGDAAGAEIEFKRSQELGRTPVETAPWLAKALLAQARYDQLTSQLSAVELDDAQALVELQVALATAYKAQGAPDKARAAVGKALARAPQAAPALLMLARLKAAAGEFDGALAVLDDLSVEQQDSVETWQLRGDLLAQGRTDLPGAIAAYQKAVALRPSQAELHAGLLSLHFAQRDLTSARRQVDAMKAVAPDNPLTTFFEAQLMFAQGEYKPAQQKLQGLLQLAPDNVNVLHLAAATELRLGALPQAETQLAKAVQLQPGFGAARVLLAKVHLLRNEPTKARAVLGPVLDGKDLSAETLVTAGQAALLGGDVKAADGYFARAAAAGPDDVRARTAAAMSQLSKGKADAAFIELQSIAGEDSGLTADMALISARMSRGEFKAALEAIDALEKKQPASAVAADLRARVHLLRKDVPAARTSFEAATARDPRYLPAVTSLAALDVVEGKPDAAKARFDRLLGLDPRNVQALLALAELKRRGGGSSDEVAALMRQAVEAQPSDPQPRMALIDHYLAADDSKAALNAAQAATTALPDNVEIAEKLARALMASGDINLANSTFGKIAVQHPSLPLGHLGLAETSLMQKNFAAANRSAKRALELAPTSVAAQRVAITAAIAAKQPQDAVKVARAMQAQRPQEALGYILEGDVEANQGRWAPAAAAYRKALDLPNPAQAPARLHAALLNDKKNAEAARFGEGWLRNHSKDVLFQLYLAGASSSQGDLLAAERYYRQVLQLQPHNPLALNNLADVLIAQNKPGAVALAERAVKAAPGRPALMDTLAAALASEGQYAKAIEMQKQVIALSPAAPVYHLTLAKIYLRAGEKTLARETLEALLKQGNEFPQRSEATELLKSVTNS